MKQIKLLFWGIIARIIHLLVPIKEKHWIMGADYGRSYREGPKYLLEYMLKNHPDYDCCFITVSDTVYNNLKEKGIPCEYN